jgi:hypothetical protein
MSDFENRGMAVRQSTRQLVLDYMNTQIECKPGRNGISASAIFRACGFDWGDYEKAGSTRQQYWIHAALHDLQAGGLVERVSPSGPWRIAQASASAS